MRSGFCAPIAGALVIVGLGAHAQAECRRVDPAGYCSDKVVHHILRRDRPVVPLKLNTALGDAVVLQLPEHAKLSSPPVVGNAAIYQHALQGESPQRILLWAQVPEGARGADELDLIGERSNMQIELGDVSVMLDLQIAAPDSSVQRLVLHFPELEAEHGQAEALRSRIEAEVLADLAEKRDAVDELAVRLGRRQMARDLMTRLKCTDLAERAMSDLLVARAHRLCTVGEQTYVWVEVHNRRRDTFELGHIELLVADGDDYTAMSEVIFEWKSPDHAETVQLDFDDAAHGIAMFPTPKSATRYAVRVKENGGRQRRVLVDDIEF